MKYISATALLLGTSAAIKLNAEFVQDLAEIKAQNDIHFSNDYRKTRQAMAQGQAQWVELPDCKAVTLDDSDIPLKDDLSNSIIATCKSYNPNAPTPPPFDPATATPPPPTAEQAYQTQWGQNYTYWSPP